MSDGDQAVIISRLPRDLAVAVKAMAKARHLPVNALVVISLEKELSQWVPVQMRDGDHS